MPSDPAPSKAPDDILRIIQDCSGNECRANGAARCRHRTIGPFYFRREHVSEHKVESMISVVTTEALSRLFPDVSQAMNVIGDPTTEGHHLEPTLSGALPIQERVEALSVRLQMYIQQMANERDELNTESDTLRLQAESVGLLIALRELRRHCPEAFED